MIQDLKPKIKVFIIEDSPVALKILKQILESSQEIEVVGTATNGIVALEQILLLKPHLVCTDLVMSKMDGLEFTKHLMSTFPLPILVISESVNLNKDDMISQLKEAGVLDIVPKPQRGFIQDYEHQAKSLINKIKLLSGVKVFTKKNNIKKPKLELKVRQNTSLSHIENIQEKEKYLYDIVGIGMSTGGPKAIEEILKYLPAKFPLPIVCTQHISIGFLSGLVDSLSSITALRVKIAKIGEKPQPGTVYFAPERYHLEISKSGKFVYSIAEPVENHRPAVTVMLQSLAQVYGSKTIGVILTGMGRDGAEGMIAIQQQGGLTIAQDEKTSVIFGMPKEAIELGAVKQILPLSQIGAFLLETVKLNSAS